MIRVILPHHLRNLANIGSEISIDVDVPVTQHAILDKIETLYPMLCGTIREHGTLKRRPFVRFFACSEDVSFDPPDQLVPEAVANGTEPFIVIGAVAGG